MKKCGSEGKDDMLTREAPNATIAAFAKTVDPDETAYNEYILKGRFFHDTAHFTCTLLSVF